MATILWFVPHADDDTLTLGAGISNHVQAGHTCVTVLCTDGSNSAVRQQLGMEAWVFADARDDEYRRAVRRLGVRPEHILVSPHRCEDGQLTAGRARRIMLAALAQHPGAWVKTHTDRLCAGRSPDHVAVGQAALDLYNPTSGPVTNLRLYVEPYVKAAFQAAHPGVALWSERGTAHTGRVLAAADEYRRVDEPSGVWGIGGRSVGGLFTALEADVVSYCHQP